MLTVNAENASLPVFTNLVKHWSNHSDQNIDWSAICCDGVIYDLLRSLKVVSLPGVEELSEDFSQKHSMIELWLWQRGAALRFAFSTHPVRKAEVVVLEDFRHEFPAIRAPFQHQSVSEVSCHAECPKIRQEWTRRKPLVSSHFEPKLTLSEPLLDHLVGSTEQRERDCESKRVAGMVSSSR